MRLPLRPSAALVICVLLGACSDKKANSGTWSPPTAEQEIEASFKLAEGTWGFYRGDSTCLGNTHTISFTPDRRSMYMTHNAPTDTTARARRTEYSVLSAGPGRYADFRHVVRGKIVDESRRTATDEQVVWDLVLVTQNRYHWHRTDWPDEGMTTAVLRCDGEKAIESWRPPAQVAPIR